MPSFDALFMRDACVDRLAPLGPDEQSQPMVCAKVRALAFTMLEYPGRQVGSYPDIHLTAIPVRHDVYPATMSFPVHRGIRNQALPRVKPGATEFEDGRFRPLADVRRRGQAAAMAIVFLAFALVVASLCLVTGAVPDPWKIMGLIERKHQPHRFYLVVGGYVLIGALMSVGSWWANDSAKHTAKYANLQPLRHR